jgi:hypothetical protein
MITVRRLAWCVGTTTVLACMGAPKSLLARDPAAVVPTMACESLAGRSYYNIAIVSAVHVNASGGIPAFCKVSGTENGTQHDLEVRLPDSWMQRYVQRGGGGFDGSIPPVAFSAAALRAGAVQGANNGGHRDPGGAALLNNPRAVERYAHGAILTATRFGKAVTQAYYGRAPQYAYYEGCSNGGRGALNAAAKYGPEFDGIVAAAPTLNLTGQISRWTSAAALPLPAAAQFRQLHAAAVAKCDARDGLEDGIVSDWAGCDFDPVRDAPASIGLTPEQAAATLNIMQDLKRRDGSVIYSGYGTGDLALGAPAFGMFGTGQMRNIVLNDAQWTPKDFDPEASLPVISSIIDDKYQFSATVPGLVQFLKSGGKAIVWHGADDALLSHKDTIRTWRQVTDAVGPQTAAAATRLYIAPGVNHCSGGDGADSFDALGALMAWVETGRAPGTLTAAKRDSKSGEVKFTRPLCQYPAWPRYRGKGDTASAASFECVVPGS